MKCTTFLDRYLLIFAGRNVQREIILVVEQQCKTVLLALSTGLIHLQSVAELAVQKGWFEGGADWE